MLDLTLYSCRQILNNYKAIIIKILILRSRVKQLRNEWQCFSCVFCYAKIALTTLILDFIIIVIKLTQIFH